MNLQPRSDREVRLWPVVAAFVGVVVVVLVVVVVIATSTHESAAPASPTRLQPMQIASARPAGADSVRAITVEGGCRTAVSAHVTFSRGSIAIQILGSDPGGACTADIKVRCHLLALREPIGGRRLVPIPATSPAESRSVIVDRSAPCPPLPVS